MCYTLQAENHVSIMGETYASAKGPAAAGFTNGTSCSWTHLSMGQAFFTKPWMLNSCVKGYLTTLKVPSTYHDFAFARYSSCHSVAKNK